MSMLNVEQQAYLYPTGIYTLRQILSSFDATILNQEVLQPKEDTSSVEITTNSLRPAAPSFIPVSVDKTEEADNRSTSENKTTTSFIFDLKKYKYDTFLSKLSCDFADDKAKFGSPNGICALNDDRLLVSNFDLDSLLLLDINGKVHEIYKDISSPKDIFYNSSNPSQAVIATRRDIVILDLNTKQIVRKSNLRGMLPWNVQYMQEFDIFAACDPSGERIVFLDKNLENKGDWSVSEYNPNQPQNYQKIYPYAACCLSRDTLSVLIHRGSKCQLQEYQLREGTLKNVIDLPPALQSYSVYVDDAKNYLIADKFSHRLILINNGTVIDEYKSKSTYEPYSVTFLSTGALCVTTWNKSFGTNGGIAILSETDLKANQ